MFLFNFKPTVDDLTRAVLRNNLPRVQQLIQQGINVNSLDSNGCTAVFVAAERGHVPIVRCLLDTAGANVNAANKKWATPLFIASQNGHLDVVELLLETGRANVNTARNDGATPLYIASQTGHVDVVKLLLEMRRADINAPTNDGWTPLFVACENEHLEIVKLLLETGRADVNAAKNDGWTALHCACCQSRLDIVEALVEVGRADLHVMLKNGETPLDVARRKYHTAIVSYLQDRLAQSLSVPPVTLPATNVSQPSVANAAVTLPPTKLTADELSSAVASNDLARVQDIIQQGANLKAHDAKGNSALATAAIHNHTDILLALVTSGEANVEGKNCNGCTALYMASQLGHLETVQVLIESCGASVIAPNQDGCVALHVACRHGHVDVVRYLLTLDRINVHAVDDSKWTALHWASCAGHLSIAQCLVEEYSADIHAVSNNGETPLDVAQTKGKQTVVSYLQRRLDMVTPTPSNGATQPVVPVVTDPSPSANSNVTNAAVTLPPTKPTADELSTAVASNDLARVQIIIQQGANLKAHDAKGNSALVTAAIHNHTDILLALVASGEANVEGKNSQGCTALYMASQLGHLETVQVLIESCGASVNAPNQDGCVALHVACRHGHVDVVRYLLTLDRINVHAVDDSKWTALHWASCAGHLSIAQCLVEEFRADIHAVSNNSETPLDVAQTKGKQTVVSYLQGRLDDQALPPMTNTSGASSNAATSASSNPGATDALDDSPKAADTQSVQSLTTEQNQIKEIIERSFAARAISESYVQSVIRKEKQLGEGFFGTVYKGVDHGIGYCFAIKVIKTEVLAGGNTDDILRAKETFAKEQKALSHFRHPNIAKLYAFSFSNTLSGNYYLIYELAEHGSLESFWKNGSTRSSLTMRRRIQIAIDIITAVQFLHGGKSGTTISSCYHRDIKSANIVLKRNLTAQLIDCGLAKFVIDEVQSNSSVGRKGSPGYICPEYGGGKVKTFDHKCDVYSFGVVLVELWTGKVQNHEGSDGETVNYDDQYIRGPEKFDIMDDIDTTLGSASSNVPSFMARFAQLALKCISYYKFIPVGDYVMDELVSIRHACIAHADDTGAPVAASESRPSGQELCERCATRPQKMDETICWACWDSQVAREESIELRELILISHSKQDDTLHETKDVNSKMKATIKQIANVVMPIANPIPRLFVMIPADKANPLKHFREYIHGKFEKKYYLYFVCAHTRRPVAARFKIHMKKQWFQMIAPVLAISLRLVQCGLSAYGMPLKLDGFDFELTSDAVAGLLDDVTSAMETMETHADLMRLMVDKQPPLVHDVPQLSGDVYSEVQKLADKHNTWKDIMAPVCTEHNPETLWVSKEVANSPGYIPILK